MIIKEFQANSQTEAIMLARQELGKDAIVTNVKEIKPKGIKKLFKKPIVKVTAAVDDNTDYKRPTTPRANNAQKALASDNRTYNPNIIDESETDASAIEQKLDSLQQMLAKQLGDTVTAQKTTVSENTEAEPEYMKFLRLVYNQLIYNEVDEKFANQLVAEIEPTLKKDSNINTILSGIYQKIILKLGQPKALEITEGKTKYIFFVGPTGVGKTTTIAKLASSLKMSKKAKVALFTMDTYRIAAVDQLQMYANILNVPLKVIYSDDEMAQAREDFKDYDIILVDTAGRSHRSREQRDDIEKLINSVPEAEREIYLVLSVTTKYRDLVKITEAYSEITDYRLIFTKLDETLTIGNIFNVRMLTDAPLSYATFGQNVPDDITRINPQNIAKQLLGGNL